MRIVGGAFRGARLNTPQSMDVRPTTDRVRETLFNILNNHISFDGLDVLDLFCGTGALGLEAISRGAATGCFVDNSRSSMALVRKNIETLNVGERCKTVICDARRFRVNDVTRTYDLVLMDPPYGKGYAKSAAENLANGSAMKIGSMLVVEEAISGFPDLPEHYKLITDRKIGDTKLAVFEYVGQ